MIIEDILLNFMLKVNVIHSSYGRLRISIPLTKKIPKRWQYDKKYLDFFIKKGINSLDFNYVTGNLLIIYNEEEITKEEILSLIKRIINISKENINELSKYTSNEKEEAYKFFISLVQPIF